MTCDFCKDYEHFKELDRTASNPHTRHDYHVALIRRSWNERVGRSHAGEMTHRPKGCGYDLKYCPECGRRIDDYESTI